MNREKSGETYTVVGEMNAHGALTLRTRGTNATYHVVEYAHESLRERLERLSTGTRVKVELTRAGSRGNVWRAEGVSLRSESAGEAAAGG